MWGSSGPIICVFVLWLFLLQCLSGSEKSKEVWKVEKRSHVRFWEKLQLSTTALCSILSTDFKHRRRPLRRAPKVGTVAKEIEAFPVFFRPPTTKMPGCWHQTRGDRGSPKTSNSLFQERKTKEFSTEKHSEASRYRKKHATE